MGPNRLLKSRTSAAGARCDPRPLRMRNATLSPRGLSVMNDGPGPLLDIPIDRLLLTDDLLTTGRVLPLLGSAAADIRSAPVLHAPPPLPRWGAYANCPAPQNTHHWTGAHASTGPGGHFSGDPNPLPLPVSGPAPSRRGCRGARVPKCTGPPPPLERRCVPCGRESLGSREHHLCAGGLDCVSWSDHTEPRTACPVLGIGIGTKFRFSSIHREVCPPPPPQGCIGGEGTSEAAPEAVR